MAFDPRFRSAPRRPDMVALVWIAGIALAMIAYAIGPDRLVSGTFDVFQNAGAWLDALVHNFTLATLQGLRAVAIGLFGTYVGLSLLAMRRGTVRGPGGLIMVAILFLLLVWGAEGANPAANARWAAALIVAAVAALGATRRLTLPPPGPPRL